MTKLWVKFKPANQSAQQELQFEIDAAFLSADMVLRALGNHLRPQEEWPFAVSLINCPDDADLGERAVRMHRSQAARNHLGVTYVSYRPEGVVSELAC
ncbi:hypothetical protein [Herbaspirillum robiniae]|uniref:hypothetical protein n=1 Tax=Herbaspirillum robiniae TaxID=2014887 RepID=UPI00101AE3E8|nr:hypothetical protein [Herbaspirillum robiniae]